MSFDKYEDFFINDIIDKSNENVNYLIMLYKPNENTTEKIEKMNNLKEDHMFILEDEKEYTENVIRIFGKYFVKQNINKCKLIYRNKKYKLKEYFDEIDANYNRNIQMIKLKLIGIDNISNMKSMFYGCYHLYLVSELQKEDILITKSTQFFSNNKPDSHSNENRNKMKTKEENNSAFNVDEKFNEISKKSIDLYQGCLSSLERISSINNGFNNENNFNVNDKIECIIPEISSTLNKIKNLSFMFAGCISLKSISDIFQWNNYKVTDINHLFTACNSLKSFPDNSNWDTSDIREMQFLFQECKSLISLPDISKWNTSKVISMNNMFD